MMLIENEEQSQLPTIFAPSRLNLPGQWVFGQRFIDVLARTGLLGIATLKAF